MPSQKQTDAIKNRLVKIGNFLDNFQRKRVVLFDIEHRSPILLRAIKYHTQLMLREVIKQMQETHLHQMIYQYAQAWRLTHGYAIEKSRELQKAYDQNEMAVSFALMEENLSGRPDDWFDLPGYEKKYNTFATNTYGKSSGRAFSRSGIFINTSMEKPEIAEAITTRANFIADVPDDQFRIMQDTLYKKYYLEGMHPDQLAKEFTASKLWDEYYIGRSQTIARTETMSIVSMARRSEYLQHEMTGHFWLIAFDSLVRDAHLANNNDGVIAIDRAFSSGQRFPGDGGDPALIVNCRCSEEATMLEDGSKEDINRGFDRNKVLEDINRGFDRNKVLEDYHNQGYEDVMLPAISIGLSQYFKYRGVTAALVDEMAKKVYYNYFASFL